LEIPEGFAFLVERFLSFWSVIIMGVECSGFINGTLIALPRSAALAFLREVRPV
jgi:hypothetical protein